MLTVNELVSILGGVQRVADTFGVSRTAVLKWRTRGIPEYVHLLCHLSALVPYTYDPSHFKRNEKGLKLICTKPTPLCLDEEVSTHDPNVHSAAA